MRFQGDLSHLSHQTLIKYATAKPTSSRPTFKSKRTYLEYESSIFSLFPTSELCQVAGTQNWILNYSKNRHLHTHSNDVGLVNYHVPEGAGEKRLIIRVLPWTFEWKSLSTLTNPETLMLDTLRGTWGKS